MRTIELVNPRQSGGGFRSYGFLNPPYNLWLIAEALTRRGFEVRVTDEVVGDIPRFDADCMMITTFTFSVKRALAIAREAQARGVPVILGGIHASDAYRHDRIYQETPTWRPSFEYFPTHFFDELQRAGSVCVGEIEPVVDEIATDIEGGTLKGLYQGGYARSEQFFPVLFPGWTDRYPLFPWQSSRGCPFDCDFCEVTRAYGKQQRTRPIDVIIEEIEFFMATRRGMNLAWNIDDIMYLNPSWTRKLMTAIYDAVGEFPWGGCATTANLYRHKEDIAFLAKTGCLVLYFGFEGYSSERMGELGVSKNRVEIYRDLIRECHANNIAVSGSVILTPDDTFEHVDAIVDYFHGIDADTISFTLLTPLLSTPVFVRYHLRGEITTFDWDMYNCGQPVLKHSQYDADDFRALREYAVRQFFPTGRIVKDVAHAVFSAFRNLNQTNDLAHTREAALHAMRAGAGLRTIVPRFPAFRATSLIATPLGGRPAPPPSTLDA